jgi:hypothetical protein
LPFSLSSITLVASSSSSSSSSSGEASVEEQQQKETQPKYKNCIELLLGRATAKKERRKKKIADF